MKKSVFMILILPAILLFFGMKIEAQSLIDESNPVAVLTELGFDGEFVLDKSVPTAYGKVYQFLQTYDGREVIGAGVNIAVGDSGKVLTVADNTQKITGLAEPVFTKDDICRLYGLDVSAVSPKIYVENGKTIPCYETPDKIASALTGEIIYEKAIPEVRQMRTLQGEDEITYELPVEYDDPYYYLIDSVRNIYLLDCHNIEYQGDYYYNETGEFDDTMAITVYNTMVEAYDFYADADNVGVEWKGLGGQDDDEAEIYNGYGRNGEIPIFVYLHYGRGYENANCGYDPYSRMAQMIVGDGNPNGYLYNQGKAADIIAHEYQHAITQLTVAGGRGINYLNEAGAISEGISDIFGCLIQGKDPSEELFWIIGEDGVVPGMPPVRDLKIPANGQVMHLADEAPLCRRFGSHEYHDCDYGNTHYNSTIITHAQYRMWDAMPEFFTRQRIGQLWFATLPMLGYDCTFKQFATQMLAAAENLNFTPEAIDVIRESLFASGLIDAETSSHIITFQDDNGEVLDRISVKEGEAAKFTPSLDPIIDDDGESVVVGWNDDISCVTGDMIVKPVREYHPYNVKVKFMSEGVVLADLSVPYGGDATPPAKVTKPSTERYDYIFTGWDKSYHNVTEDITINALFKEELHQYKIKYISDGMTVSESFAAYEDIIENIPIEKKGYVFEGWFFDEEFTSALSGVVLSDTVLYAKWHKDNTWVIILAVTLVAFVLIVGGVLVVVVFK